MIENLENGETTFSEAIFPEKNEKIMTQNGKKILLCPMNRIESTRGLVQGRKSIASIFGYVSY